MTTPDDLMRIAREIRANFTDDVGSRSTVNRAYYATYHAANILAHNLLLPSPATESGSHQSLFNRLIDCEKHRTAEWLKVKSIGYTASKILKPYRVHADYNLDDPLSTVAADEALEKTALIIQQQKAILQHKSIS